MGDPQPNLGWDGAHTRGGYVQAGMGRVEPRLRCVRRDGGTWKGFAIHHQQGTPPKTGEARLELVPTCPHPRNPPAHPHPRRPPRLHPSLSPCPPALPAYPRSACRVAKVELFQSTASPSQPQAPVQINPIPSQGPQAADCTFIALRPADRQ